MADKGEREVLEAFGNRIVRLREARGWTRPELAGHLGVTRQRLGHWERGEATPPLDALIALRLELGVSIDELVTGEAQNGFCRKEKELALSHLTALMSLVR
jgi:transcriptional regulator with XRE-family HTH domain